MKYFSSVFLALLLLCPMTAHSEVTTEVSCFRSQEGKDINFEFRSYYDSVSKWSGASVQYSKSKEAISLVFKDSEEEVLDPNRPSQFTTRWIEVSEGLVTGDYAMVSQGALIYAMIYTNYKSGKRYVFESDSDMNPPPQTGCQW
ncbi:hypothetical protein PS870_03560 [Pseudomonas fluorescens]|uniref:Uncharacterized protein n=1 Tax=Pseudomonas fluorescens TaxID=294 RepID=A0A5E7LWA2_PSEFL|nr:hypothetical protein [Pseudomonas mandelii]VVP16015.1 hypothetical protein PS870_03560 [Pseudomonas fluorescens]